MSCCEGNKDFCINAGETFDPVVRWSSDTLLSTAITAISKAAPAVVTAVGHGIPTGWRAAVVSALGMTQINAKSFPPDDDELSPVTSLTANTISLDDVNSGNFSTYTSGGWLVHYQPVSLTGVTGTFRVWDNVDRTGTPLVTLTVGSGITLDNTLKTISIVLETAAITWTTGYYALDMNNAGDIKRVLKGILTIQ